MPSRSGEGKLCVSGWRQVLVLEANRMKTKTLQLPSFLLPSFLLSYKVLVQFIHVRGFALRHSYTFGVGTLQLYNINSSPLGKPVPSSFAPVGLAVLQELLTAFYGDGLRATST